MEGLQSTTRHGHPRGWSRIGTGHLAGFSGWEDRVPSRKAPELWGKHILNTCTHSLKACTCCCEMRDFWSPRQHSVQYSVQLSQTPSPHMPSFHGEPATPPASGSRRLAMTISEGQTVCIFTQIDTYPGIDLPLPLAMLPQNHPPRGYGTCSVPRHPTALLLR